MTYIEFIAACTERCIDPSLAKEDALVCHYLATRQDELVLRTLDTCF